MNRINSGVIAAIKKSLKLLEESIEREPVIFIDPKGRFWFNSRAEDFLSKEGILREDFVEWFKIGSIHLQNFRYGNVSVRMMELPGKNIIALLKNETEKAFKKFALTQKERETLRHLVRGESNKRIAGIMKISPGTVNTHLDNIYSKLGCSNRLSACLIALRNGLFLPGGENRSLKR